MYQGEMPQIRCPNCGFTINLEKRKEIDIRLILAAVKKRERSFSELLRITGLPRKTLSLRLKELCQQGLITKDGKYKINGEGKHYSGQKGPMLAKIFFLLIILGLGIPTAYVMATMLISPAEVQQPKIIGQFKVAVTVNNLEDLHDWQVVIVYNSDQITFLNYEVGDFWGIGTSEEEPFPYVVNATDIGDGILCFGGTLGPAEEGKSGSGVLLILEFGYFTVDYQMPEIKGEVTPFKTILLDSYGNEIPFEGILDIKEFK